MEKLVLCAGLLACAVLLPPWPTAVVVLAVVFAASRLAGLPVAHLPRMLSMPMVFIVVAGVSTAVSINTSGPLLATSPEAVLAAGKTIARATAATAAMLLLASTTPMSDLTDSMRRVGLPAPCVDVVTVMYRMIFLLLESLAVVRKSQVARLGYCTVGKSVHSAGLMTASVLLRAWRRGHALERGLAGRNLGTPLARASRPSVSHRFVVGAVAANALVAATAAMPVLV